ncbi:MAG: DUF2071 domain-containing protein [Candidatus Obscuribacterales bacterium]|nr:DUF2071 domain-containing protein [Candidatus Obscuribacterales bacterium]
MSPPKIEPPVKPTFINVITELRHFTLITYSVEPQALAAHLPDGFEPEVFTLKDGRQCSFVSAAVFHDFGFHPAFLSWPTFDFEQTNYRAYVLRGGQRCVWFFGTTLHTPFVLVPICLWRLPWHYADMKISTSWQDGVCKFYHYVATGKWGNAEVEMEGTNEPSGALEGFLDEDETTLVLTHPLLGYYRRTDGQIGTYGIWHDKLAMNRCVVRKAKFEVFEKLNLITPDALPHSALIQHSTEFVIYLPPSTLQPS